MLTYQMASALVAAIGFMATGTAMALTPNLNPQVHQPIVYSSAVYPAGVTWMEMLEADRVLYKLAERESAGTFDPFIVNPHDAKITGYVSTGIFQYQPGTFLEFVKKYDAMPGATDEEIMMAINDPYIQIFITRRTLIDGGWSHWYNSFIFLGLPRNYSPTWTPTASGLVFKK